MDDQDETMILFAACVVCGHGFASDPHTVPSVWINDVTRCPLRPDATPINPDEPGTHREPLCDLCAPLIRPGVGRPTPVAELFPHARLDRISRPARAFNETISYMALAADGSEITGEFSVPHHVSRQLAEQLAAADAAASLPCGEVTSCEVTSHIDTDGREISAWALFDEETGAVSEQAARNAVLDRQRPHGPNDQTTP